MAKLKKRKTRRPKEIDQVVRQIVDNFHPRKVILFGSYAYGRPHKDSDADLLVIMHTRRRSIQVAAQIAAQVDHPIALDILVKTPAQIKKRIELGDFFLKEVVEKGMILYEAPN